MSGNGMVYDLVCQLLVQQPQSFLLLSQGESLLSV